MYVQLFHFIIFKHDITSVFLIILQKYYEKETMQLYIRWLVGVGVLPRDIYIDVSLSIGI